MPRPMLSVMASELKWAERSYFGVIEEDSKGGGRGRFRQLSAERNKDPWVARKTSMDSGASDRAGGGPRSAELAKISRCRPQNGVPRACSPVLRAALTRNERLTQPLPSYCLVPGQTVTTKGCPLP